MDEPTSKKGKEKGCLTHGGVCSIRGGEETSRLTQNGQVLKVGAASRETLSMCCRNSADFLPSRTKDLGGKGGKKGKKKKKKIKKKTRLIKLNREKRPIRTGGKRGYGG